MLLPQPDSAYEQVSFEKTAMAKNKHFDAQGVRYDRDKVSLPVLSVGQLVRVQDEKSGQWQALATVIEARPDGLLDIVDIGGREQLRSRHMLRPEPVPSPRNESERDGPIFGSERDGPKVGVIPSPTPTVRRSHRLLENNSQGNRLIPASACAEVNLKERSLTNSGNSRSSTGKDFPPSRGYPSLSLQTRLLTSTQTASVSSTCSGLPLRQEPLSFLPSPSSGSLSHSAATFGPGMTGGATTSLLRPSQVEWFSGGCLPVGPNLCQPSQIPSNMTSHPN